MTGMPPPNSGQQQQPANPMQQAPVTQQQQQGLPPTGLQQQLSSMNSLYGNVQGAQMGGQPGGRSRIGGKFNNVGYNVREWQFSQAQQQGSTELGQNNKVSGGSLDSMARNMAQRFGMSIGRGRLVDEAGNFLYTPKQLSEASGGQMTMGEAAANMNYISQALTKQQNEKQQALGIAAIQTGLGQVQQRGRGSLASMQTGQYEAMADMYANKEYEAADFSYWIQKEQQDIATQLQKNEASARKKQAQAGFWTGAAIAVVGFASGSLTTGVAGLTQAGASAETAGYF